MGKVFLWFAALLIVTALAPNAAWSVEKRQVDCNAGQKISSKLNSALAAAQVGEAIRIQLTGTCKETVRIKADNVTLETKPSKSSRATLRGKIIITGAKRAVIKRLIVTGAGDGIVVEEGASADIVNSRVKDNKGYGILVFGNSVASLFDNKITGNGRLDGNNGGPFFESGVHVTWNSNVFSEGNLIADNGWAAVVVNANSYFRNGEFLPTGSPDPADMDTYIQRGCTEGASPGSCGAPGTDGLWAGRQSLLELRNASVTGTVPISGRSSFEARDSKIFGNVTLFGDSAGSIRQTTKGNGQFICSFGIWYGGNNPEFYECGDFFVAP